MGKVGFDGSGNEGEGVAILLAAGFDHGQHRLDKAADPGVAVSNLRVGL